MLSVKQTNGSIDGPRGAAALLGETETAVALYSGRLKLARQKRQLLSELRSSYGRTEAAGTIATDEAIVEAEFGYLPHAQSSSRNSPANVKLMYSSMQLSCHPLRARLMRHDRLIENLRKAFPQDTLVNAVWASVASAQAKIKRGNPQKALELLEVARPYELGWQAVFMPIYVRGEAYLRLRKGAEAAVEFQKILGSQRRWFDFRILPVSPARDSTRIPVDGRPHLEP